MKTLLFQVLLAAHLGPLAPDAPLREPQMAASSSMVGLTYGAGNGIYFRASYDAGQTFSAPVQVAAGGIVPLSRHRGPRIAMIGNTIVITAVTGQKAAEGAHAHGLPSDGDLMAWRSTDGGKHWSAGAAINDVPGAATEGLHSLAGDGKSILFAVWLDKRAKGTKLYGARSTDAGATWQKNVPVYESPAGTICECCHPSVVIDGSGQVLVMWRNWLNGNRDMYLTRSADGVTFPEQEKLGAGSWALNACPMDGGGLAVAGTKVVTAWRRGESVFLAEPGRSEAQIGTGKDVALTVNAGRTYVMWVNGAAIEAWTGGKAEVLAKSGAFPSMTSLPQGGVLAAWEQDGGIEIRRLE
ncbi:MAG TPA: sialidase family protein [Candidatus Baltobacteraceae bacterium]|nr:sialidase family protein [Candidatus Baltobacteraceae bacterium]